MKKEKRLDRSGLPNLVMDTKVNEKNVKTQEAYFRTQACPVCTTPIGDMPGSKDAVCRNCGYKDPCCGD